MALEKRLNSLHVGHSVFPMPFVEHFLAFFTLFPLSQRLSVHIPENISPNSIYFIILESVTDVPPIK